MAVVSLTGLNASLPGFFFLILLVANFKSGSEVNSQRERQTESAYGRQRQSYKMEPKPTAQAVSWSVPAVSTAWITFPRLCSRPDQRASTKTARTTQHPSDKKRKGKKKSRADERKWDWSQRNICSRSFLVESVLFSLNVLFVHRSGTQAKHTHIYTPTHVRTHTHKEMCAHRGRS